MWGDSVRREVWARGNQTTVLCVHRGPVCQAARLPIHIWRGVYDGVRNAAIASGPGPRLRPNRRKGEDAWLLLLHRKH